MEKSIKVKTLLGTKNLDFSIACLKSFINSSSDQIHLVIYEDGTITEDDAENLKLNLGSCSIIEKTKRDEKLQFLMQDYPKCWNFRQGNVLAQKLFDVALYDNFESVNEGITFIDSDVLFLKQFRFPNFEETPTFIQDSQNAYSFSPADFIKVRNNIFPRVNTGLFYFPYDLFNLKLIEDILSDNTLRKGLDKYKTWAEQTIWALLASRSQLINYFEPTQIVMAEKNLKLNSDTVAVHLVTTYRHHFGAVSKTADIMLRNDEFIGIEMVASSRYLRKSELVLERVMKKIPT